MPKAASLADFMGAGYAEDHRDIRRRQFGSLSSSGCGEEEESLEVIATL
jgi:hypothetical protein